MAAKRRLPVLPSRGDADEDPTRAPWQWVGFGTIAIFVVWLPLSAAASVMTSKMLVPIGSGRFELAPAAMPAFVGLFALALGLATVVGGFLVGRWGGPGVGVREACFAGIAAAVVAVGASWLSLGIVLSALVVVPFALVFAALGGKWGVSARSARR